MITSSPRLALHSRDTWTREAQLAYDVVLIVFIYLLPLFVVCLSQHIVTVHLRQSQRLLSLMGHQITLAWTRRRQRLTRLCVLMAALFVLSWSPNHVCNLLTKIFHINNYATEILLDYSMCLALSNAVTGPILLIVTCSVYSRFIVRLAGRLSNCCCFWKPQTLRVHSTTFRSSLSVCTPMDIPVYIDHRAQSSRAEPGEREQNSPKIEDNMLISTN